MPISSADSWPALDVRSHGWRLRCIVVCQRALVLCLAAGSTSPAALLQVPWHAVLGEPPSTWAAKRQPLRHCYRGRRHQAKLYTIHTHLAWLLGALQGTMTGEGNEHCCSSCKALWRPAGTQCAYATCFQRGAADRSGGLLTAASGMRRGEVKDSKHAPKPPREQCGNASAAGCFYSPLHQVCQLGGWGRGGCEGAYCGQWSTAGRCNWVTV